MQELIAIARTNVSKNPNLQSLEGYLDGIEDEVHEVQAEMRTDNRVHLEDELSDVLWDYVNVLAILEKEGMINSVESVIAHGIEKYDGRLPALISGSVEQWNDIKAQQKEELKKTTH